MKMIVIDDDAQFTSHLLGALPRDVDVEVVHDTSAAIESLRTAELVVFVLDLRMAPMPAADAGSEGLAMLGVIRGGRRGRVPVAVVAGSSDADTLAWCATLGAEAVLHKVDGLSQVFQAASKAVPSTPGDGAGGGPVSPASGLI